MIKRGLFYCVTLISIFFVNSLKGQLTIDSGGRVAIGSGTQQYRKLSVFNNIGLYANYSIYSYTDCGAAYNYVIWTYEEFKTLESTLLHTVQAMQDISMAMFMLLAQLHLTDQTLTLKRT